MRKTKYIILISAILLAMTAGYMSIFGLTTLLKGNIYVIGIMAILLEIAKILNITYLHNEWKRIKILHKIFIFLTTIILLVITSSGVFGFLKNSSIETIGKVKQIELLVSQVDRKINFLTEDEIKLENKIKEHQLQLADDQKLLNDITSNQTNMSVLNDTTSKFWAKYSFVNKASELKDKVTEQIDIHRENIAKEEQKHNVLRNDIDSLESYMLDLQNNNIGVKQELGPFYSFSQLIFNKEVLSTKELETTVNWYIFILIFVFDPTAVSLILIYLNINKRQNIDSNGDSSTSDNNTPIKKDNTLEAELHHDKDINKQSIKEGVEHVPKKDVITDDFTFKDAPIKKTDNAKIKPKKMTTWYDVDSAGGMKKR